MPKNLRLRGISSFCSKALDFAVVQRDDVIEVDDGTAQRLLAMERTSDHDGLKIHLFEETTDPAARSFVSVSAAPSSSAPASNQGQEPDSEEGASADPAPVKKTARRVAQRQ